MKGKIFILLLCVLILLGVGTSFGRKYFRVAIAFSKKPFIDLVQLKQDTLDLIKLREDYPLLRDTIEMKRKEFAKEYLLKKTEEGKRQVLKKAGVYLRNVLVDKVYPTWYGTVWDFNGITETPGGGMIACGYFVSTTLKHTGVNVNRYKLAQKYSHAIVKSLCKDVKVYNDFESMMTYVKSGSDDVYIVGLDNHVGHISKKGGEINFVHSSYVYPGHVLSEAAASSLVLGGSGVYVIGNMTSNTSLIKSWLSGTVVKVVE